MLIQHTILDNGAQLGIWKIEETAEELMTNLSVRTLANERFQRYTNKTRISEWLAVRNLLKTICCEEKQICYTESGKPYLSDNSYKISITHTKGYVAVLIHSILEVGIDIEQQSNRVLKLKERFMSAAELSNLDSTNEATHALLYWSAKETLFKILPESEIDFREHLHINNFPLKESGQIGASETKTLENQKFEISYQVFADFVLTFALSK